MFELYKELQEYQAKIREFAQSYRDYANLMDEKNEGGEKILRDLGNKDLLGMKIPTKYGGLGLGEIAFAIATEELGAEGGNLAHTLHTQLNALQLLLSIGGDIAKDLIEQGTKGKVILGVGVTEPEAGSDVSALKTTARREGDKFIINGEKIFTSSASFSDKILVLARTSGNPGDKDGITLFEIDSKSQGVLIQKLDLIGMRGAGVSYVKLNNVEVSKDSIIGKEGDAYKGAIKALMIGRNGYAGIGVGIARGALDATIERVNKRVQFKKPLIENQWISFKLAEAYIEVEASRLLTWKAADLLDKGIEALTEASMAKYYSAKTAIEVTRLGVQFHGGQGLIKGNKVERLYRDAKILEISEGTNEMQLFAVTRYLKK